MATLIAEEVAAAADDMDGMGFGFAGLVQATSSNNSPTSPRER